MGTNYYAFIDRPTPCSTCGHRDEGVRIHIGKSSVGWCFALHVYPGDTSETGGLVIEDKAGWDAVFARPDVEIQDEDGYFVETETVLECIEHRSGGDVGPVTAWLAKNRALAGPNNLARHALEPGHCVRHGDGTWDEMVGTFS